MQKTKSKKKLKCYVLMVAETFPVGHPKAGLPTLFKEKILKGEKVHTIRKNSKLWANRVYDVLTGKAYISIRTWTGKPYHSKQKQFAVLQKVGFELFGMDRPTSKSEAPDVYWQIGQAKCGSHLWDVAKNDGLSYEDFKSWFFPCDSKPANFNGCILHFSDFRYNKNELTL